MDISNLLEKYKTIEFKHHPDGLLFPIDWDLVYKTNRCPLCGSKLYDSRKYVGHILCRSKTHRFFKIKAYKKLSPKTFAPKSLV